MYERSGGSMSIQERFANRGATTHVDCAAIGLSEMADHPLAPNGKIGSV